MRTVIVLPIALGASMGSIVQGALLFQDVFTGYTAGNISGQGFQGTGGTSTWGVTNSGTGASTEVLASNLPFGSLVNSGGSLRVTSGAGASSSGFTVAAISLASTTVGTGTLFSSFLVQRTGDSNANTNSVFARVNTSSGSAGNAFLYNAVASPIGSQNVGARYGAGTEAAVNATTIELGVAVTYIAVSRYTNVGSAATAGSPGIMESAYLTLAQFGAASSDTEDFNSIFGRAEGSGVNQVSAKASSSFTSGTSTFSGASLNRLQFGAAEGGEVATFDAIRWGSTFNSVVVIPEPATGALALIAAAAAKAPAISAKRPQQWGRFFLFPQQISPEHPHRTWTV